MTYQAFGNILWLHPTCDVGDGMVQLIDHYVDLRKDGLKFWLMWKDSNLKGKLVLTGTYQETACVYIGCKLNKSKLYLKMSMK